MGPIGDRGPAILFRKERLKKRIEKKRKKERNPVLLGTAAWNLKLNSRPLGICLAPCFYDAFLSGPGAAIFLVDVELVFFAPWPQNFYII